MIPLLKKKLISTIESFSPARIMIIGDLMLDQYTWGKVDRISPEAPIPVLRVEKEEFRLGGAASAVANVKALNCEVIPVGVIGKGEAGNRILEILNEQEISTAGVVSSQKFQTIVKKRVLTPQQQLIRVDYETERPNVEHFEKELMERSLALMTDVDGVILSDYGKGVLTSDLCQAVIQRAKELNIPCVCDPAKGADYKQYKGITTIKPNRMETELATGIKLKDQASVLKAAAKLQTLCDAQFLSISLDKEGILFYKDENTYEFIETRVHEVFDVTGAGDMVISIIGVLLSAGVDEITSINMANVAAGIEISHMGVVPIPWAEILSSLTHDGLSQKITTLEQLKTELDHSTDTPIIFTNGYFDQISAGHLRFLLEISSIPGKLVVAINSDQSIKKQKGSYPLLNQTERARLLASVDNIYKIIIFDKEDASELIREISPKYVIKGEEFEGKAIPENSAIQDIGAEVQYIRHFSWKAE